MGNRRRVVVTGLGIICPIGNTVEEAWAALIAGRSGVGPITRFDPTGYETTFAGEVRGFDAEAVVGRKDARRMDRHTQLAIAAMREAQAGAGLVESGIDTTRVGVLIGTGMGAMETLERGMETLLTQGPSRIGPFFSPMALPNMASGMAAIAVGARGPCFATASACASSAHAVGEATEMIRRGAADVMYAGGAESPVTRLSVAGFNAMGALSRRNDAPAAASRPFDADRDGFVLGEGAAVVVLEALESAERRGVAILGEVLGYGASDDANHMVQPAPGGEGVARAMALAMTDGGVRPVDIGYVNAHATSTKIGERYETAGIKTAFGDVVGRLPVSSTKSMTGHLLGAAGSLEFAFSTLAIRDGILPPTINYATPDPECDLDVIPNVARRSDIAVAMSNSLGFGGHNVSLVIARYSR